MTASAASHTISAKTYDAWLFDLDGVITDTASVHGAAWKKTFDNYLEKVAKRDQVPFKSFEIDPDYFEYVDGKPRYEGVDSFLRSRGIEIPWGTPDDGPQEQTVCGVGNEKNIFFQEILAARGADIFDSTVSLIRELRKHGVKVAVVSSSKNCTTILGVAGLSDLFEVQIDGVVAAAEKIAGKPKPDTYVEAAKRLGAAIERSVVIEDAISGVQAGRAGNFGLVLGIARHDEPEVLLENGADIVVKDMAEVEISG
jgi:alpha,alpha-trehalase